MLITPNLRNFQRVLHTLAATQEVPRHTRLQMRRSTRVPPTYRGAPIPPPSSRGGILSCVVGKEFPAFPSHLKRRCSPQSRREEIQFVPPFRESLRCLCPFQGILFSLQCLDFQADDRLTPRWHVGQPMGKPRGKAKDPFIHGKGKVTPLLQLGMKAHVHVPTRDED